MKEPPFIMPKEITAINLRHKLGEILDQVANNREHFLIKRAGIPAAILLDDYRLRYDIKGDRILLMRPLRTCCLP